MTEGGSMKRYSMEWDGIASDFMELTKDGKYVEYEDVQALLKENERLSELVAFGERKFKNLGKRYKRLSAALKEQT